MNFIIGRQCFNLGQLEDSQDALRKLLSYQSFQPPLQQASNLREFLAVFKVIIRWFLLNDMVVNMCAFLL